MKSTFYTFLKERLTTYVITGPYKRAYIAALRQASAAAGGSTAAAAVDKLPYMSDYIKVDVLRLFICGGRSTQAAVHEGPHYSLCTAAHLLRPRS